jgi:hypothetical protein
MGGRWFPNCATAGFARWRLTRGGEINYAAPIVESESPAAQAATIHSVSGATRRASARAVAPVGTRCRPPLRAQNVRRRIDPLVVIARY